MRRVDLCTWVADEPRADAAHPFDEGRATRMRNPCVDCGEPEPQDERFICKGCNEISLDMLEANRARFAKLRAAGVSRAMANAIIIARLDNKLVH